MDDSKEQAKETLCLLLAAAGGELKNKVALYKAFYYAHLFYWQSGEGTLTDYPIVRMPQGPGIDQGNALLEELKTEGKIRIEKAYDGPYPEYVFSLVPPYSVDRNDPRYMAVDKAMDFVRGKSAAEISQIVHDYSRSWQTTPNGEELNIYLDLLDEEEYSALQTRLREAKEIVDRVFA